MPKPVEIPRRVKMMAGVDGLSRRASKSLLAICIFLGAMLLFLLEPLVAKAILPWFGGGASVWTTCMLFFQVVLLGGYAYAHLGTTTLGRRPALGVHLLLIALAVVVLPVIPSERLRPAGAGNPIAQVLAVLTLTAGLPFLVLSATGTLVQTWWARLDPDSPPYRLYALSNAGSMAGLVAYPLLLEPLAGLRTQAYLWSGGMVLFALVCAACATIGCRARAAAAGRPAVAAPPPPPSRAICLAWVLLPMVPSVMLLAVTAAITQHVAPIPFLWIVPLALYLLSFILCFECSRAYRRDVFMPLYGAMLLTLCVVFVVGKTKLGLPLQLGVYGALLFAACMVCHGELYRLRPAAGRLSGFYLAVSLGGALGGAFAAVVAPMAFGGMWELHLSVGACALVCLGVAWQSPRSALHHGRPNWAWFGLSMLGAMAAVVLATNASGGFLGERLLTWNRGFYGALTVQRMNVDEPQKAARALFHGGIIHGLQLEEASHWNEPLSYYWPESGVGRVMQNTASRRRHVGVVGLGAGTLVAYGNSGDRFDLYEINPQVVDFARNWFTFLRNTPAQVSILEGDARITLEQQQSQQFDLLLLDAFSGDSIPVHLLTREAFQLYARHLRPDGIIAFHITNAYLDLEPVVAQAAQAIGFSAVVADTTPLVDDGLRFHTRWAILSRNPADLYSDALRPVCRPARTDPRITPWTDDRSDLLSILR